MVGLGGDKPLFVTLLKMSTLEMQGHQYGCHLGTWTHNASWHLGPDILRVKLEENMSMEVTWPGLESWCQRSTAAPAYFTEAHF